MRLVLEDEADIEVVGEAGDGLDAVERIVELDARPRADGRAHAGRVGHRGDAPACARSCPSVKVAILTVSESDEDLFAAVRAGATGYLLKEVSIEELPDAVRAVARGPQPDLAVDGVAAARREFNVLSRRVEEQRGNVPRLSDRELEVLRLVARGLSNGTSRPSW